MKKAFFLLLEYLACVILMFILSIMFLGGLELAKNLRFSLVVGLILFLFWKYCFVLYKEDPDEGLNVFEKKDQ